MHKKMDNLTSRCRACLSKSESFTYFLFQNISPEVYCFCTSLEVMEDSIPKSLCDSCYGLLTKFSEFKKMCIQSEDILHNNLNNFKSEDKDSYEVKVEYSNDDLVKSEDLGTNDAGNEVCNISYEDEYTTDDKHVISAQTSVNKKKLKSVPKSQKRIRKFQFSCELCQRKFGIKERFENHKLEHEGRTTSIHCAPCNKTFTHWSGLVRHNAGKHSQLSPEQLTCQVCLKVFKSPCTLRSHRNSHKEPKICHVCGREFKTNLTLTRHQETHIENRERQYPCQQCGNKFLSKKSHDHHVAYRHNHGRFSRRDSDHKPLGYMCHYCGYSTFYKTTIIKHIQVHEGRRQREEYKCDLCPQICVSKFSLVSHIRKHTGERPFPCSDCSKSFPTKGRLVIHQRIHTGEKPYKCPGCEKSFSQRGTLTLHVKRRHKTIDIQKQGIGRSLKVNNEIVG